MKVQHKPTRVRRHEIVEVARRIILTRGIGHLTIEAIADGVGLTEGAIYRHFTSKQEVLLSLLDDVEHTVFETLGKAQEGERSALGRLEKVLEADLLYLEEHEGTSFIAAQAANLGDPKIRTRICEIVNRYLGTIRGILDEGVRSGEIREDIDLEGAAILFLGIVRGSAMADSVREGGPKGLSHWHRPLWTIYREGLIPRSP